MATIKVDPLTRIEGHLKIETNVSNGVVTGATVSGTMARGIEKLLAGRDPRDATVITERICGVCFSAHGWTSSIAVENAHGTTALPEAARLIRNLIVAPCWLHDHILHFYHLSAVDFMDLGVLANYTGTDTFLLKLKDKIVSEGNNPPVEGEYIGPFLPTYAPDNLSVKNVDKVATLITHYFDALKIQAKAKKMSALFGGKQPHQSGIIVGGVTRLPSAAQIAEFKTLLQEIRTFIQNVYVKDVMDLAAGPLVSASLSDIGVGYKNYMSYGGFPESDGSYFFPEGAIVGETLQTTDRALIEKYITEDISKSWYQAGSEGHPSVSDQVFDLNKAGAHTFVKAPRVAGFPMEVGPLARMMMAVKHTAHPAHQHPLVQDFNYYLSLGLTQGMMARHIARALETQMLCDGIDRWIGELETLVASSTGQPQLHDAAHWDPPYSGEGYGMTEAARGALGHWIKIQNYQIANYSCVVPTTWNSSPVDSKGKIGPYEKALIGCPVPDPKNPINIGRVIRSFDPCLACAVHVIDPEGDMSEFVVKI